LPVRIREFSTITLLPPSATTTVRTEPWLSMVTPSRTSREPVPVPTTAAP
jgi:hypothetical protein